MEELDAAALVGFKLCDRGFKLLQCCFVQIDFFRILERCCLQQFIRYRRWRFAVPQYLQATVPHYHMYPWFKVLHLVLLQQFGQSCEKFNHFILAALGVFQILHAYTIEQVCVSVPQMTQRNLVPLPKKKHQVEITAIGYGLAPKEHVYLPDSCFLLHVKVVIALGLNGHHATGHIAVTRW